jgi:hypothetical protein
VVAARLRSVRRRALARFSLAAAGDALRCLDGRLRSFDWVEPLRLTARAAHARAVPATVLRPRSYRRRSVRGRARAAAPAGDPLDRSSAG